MGRCRDVISWRLYSAQSHAGDHVIVRRSVFYFVDRAIHSESNRDRSRVDPGRSNSKSKGSGSVREFSEGRRKSAGVRV